MRFASGALTTDRFLGGRLTVLQPRRGYRAATDPVFLAAAVPAAPGEEVLDLGCGAGVATLCLAARVPGLSLSGVEVQAAYAELACRNAVANGVRMTVFEADLAALPTDLRTRSFDHVIANPPFFPAADPAAGDPGRDRAQREATPLAKWVEVGLRRTRPGGWFTVIHRAARLGDLLCAVQAGAGAVRVLPIVPRAGRDAGRVIVQARKGARGPVRLLSPFVVHAAKEHREDGEDFTDAARTILHDGAALAMSPG